MLGSVRLGSGSVRLGHWGLFGLDTARPPFQRGANRAQTKRASWLKKKTAVGPAGG
jgi:hypothetical protein